MLKSWTTHRTRTFWIAQTAVWTGYVVQKILEGVGARLDFNFPRLAVMDAVTGFFLTLVLRYGMKAVWNASLQRRIIVGSALVLLCSGAYALIYAQEIGIECAKCVLPNSVLSYLSYFAGAFYILLTWLGAYVGIKLALQLQEEREGRLQATAMAHQAQLRMLRYQLNPHFLFNTLNSILCLILEDQRDQADKMLVALSGFLRYSLDGDPQQRITLNEEVAALKLYLLIEQARFGSRLRVSYAVDEAAQAALVPSMILQPLVENAVKYAVAASESGGSIFISARVDGADLELLVSDDGQGSADYSAAAHGSGIGLNNIRARLSALYAMRQRFDIGRGANGGTQARIRIAYECVQER